MGGKTGILDTGAISYSKGQIYDYTRSGRVMGNGGYDDDILLPALDHLNIYDPKDAPPEPPVRQTRAIFEGESIMEADILTSKVFQENLMVRTRLTEHIKYDSYGTSALVYAKNYADVGDRQFMLYYRHGKWEYEGYLPDALITGTTIRQFDIEAAIKSENPWENVYIDRIVLGFPDEKDWVRFQLQEIYGYNIAKDKVKMPGDKDNWYKLDSYVFNPSTGKYDVTLKTYDNLIKLIEYHDIMTPCSHMEDPDLYCYYREVWKRPKSGGFIYDGDTNKILGKDNTPESEWELVQSRQHSKHPNYLLPLDQIVDHYYDEKVQISVTPKTVTVSVPSFGSGMYYDVHYRTDIDEVKFWIYSANSDRYPALKNPINTVTEFDMFPLAAIRSCYQFIHDTPGMEKRTEQTKDLLRHIGIDYDDLVDNLYKNADIKTVRDVFFGFCISPSNNDWSISAALYESLNWILSLLPPAAYDETSIYDNTKYSISFREHPFNSMVFFKYRSNTYYDGRYHVEWKNYDLWESEYSHTVKKIKVKITEMHRVKIAKVHDMEASGQIASSYRMIVCGGEKYYKYEYSDMPGKHFMSKVGTIESTVCYCDTSEDYPEEGCLIPCKAYYPYATDMTGNSGFWSCDTLDYVWVTVETHEENTYLIEVAFQIHRDRYQVIQIVDVSQTYVIQDGGNTVYKNVYPDDPKFVFPLAVEVERKLTLMEKTALLGESAYLLIYAVQWTHLEWYETGAFKQFLNILSFAITVVLTIVSAGSMSYVGLTTTQALIQTLTKIIVPVALSMALKALSSLINDPMIRTLASIGVMIVATFGSAYMNGGLSLSNMDFGLATSMAKIPVNAYKIYSSSILEVESAELQKQQIEFSGMYSSISQQFASILQSFSSGIDTSFLANLTYGEGVGSMNSSLVNPNDYFTAAFANNVPSLCSREAVYKATVENFCSNSLRLYDFYE